MKTSLKKWGNSVAVRIPASVMEAADLHVNELVEVCEEEGRIVIEPVRQKSYDLTILLKGITPKNLPKAADFGHGEGKEVW